jgi:hypothetical protein
MSIEACKSPDGSFALNQHMMIGFLKIDRGTGAAAVTTKQENGETDPGNMLVSDQKLY